MLALALLDLPAGHVRVDEQVGVGSDQGRARTEDEDKPPAQVSHLLAEPLDKRGCEEVVEAPRAEEAEDGIAAEVRFEPPFELVRRPQRPFRPDDGGRRERLCQGGFDLVDEHAGVALDGDDAPGLAPSAAGKHRCRFAPALGDDARVVADAHRRKRVVGHFDRPRNGIAP